MPLGPVLRGSDVLRIGAPGCMWLGVYSLRANLLEGCARAKAAEDWPHSKPPRDHVDLSRIRQVLECGQSSAALAFDVLSTNRMIETALLVSHTVRAGMLLRS